MGAWELAQWRDGAECACRGSGMCKAQSADKVAGHKRFGVREAWLIRRGVLGLCSQLRDADEAAHLLCASGET